jgi:hypothetical protein
MPHKKELTDHHLLSIFRQKGFIVPKTEAEVAAFEQALNEHSIPPLPKELDDASAILKRPYSKGGIIRLSTETNEDDTQLARAARDGKEISLSVLEKMRKDREDAEKDK